MIITKTVKVKWANINKLHYISKNYLFTKCGEEFEAKAKDLPSTSKIIVEYKCDICGELNKASYGSLKDKDIQYCKSCGLKMSAKKRAEGKIEEIKKEFDDRGYILISKEFIKVNAKLTYTCKTHPENGEMQISYNKFKYSKQGCRSCGNEQISLTKRFSIEKVKSIFKEKQCELLSEEYENQKTILEYKCLNHPDQGVMKTTLQKFNPNKYGCMLCAIESHKYTIEELEEIFNSKGCKLVDKEYHGCNYKLSFICNNHIDYGVQEVVPTDFIRGSSGCKICGKESQKEKISGQNNYNWKGGIYDDESTKFRKTFQFKKWKKDVFQRDGYTCQCCGRKGCVLNAHHLDGYNWCEERRLDIDNGVTLCEECHITGDYAFHKLYGKGYNTKAQYEEWLQEVREYQAL